MHKRENILDVTRQELVIGTSCITSAAGLEGYKTEYVLASAQLRIAAALEKGNDILRATRAGFDAEAVEDGMNHFHLKYEKGLCLFDMHVLASSPEQAETWIRLLNKFGQDLVEAANAGRAMRFTANVPVAKAHHEAFGAALVEYNQTFAKPDPSRVFLAAFDFAASEAVVRYADPAALFQLGMHWRNVQQRLQQEGGLADA